MPAIPPPRKLDVILRTHSGLNVHGGGRLSDSLGGKQELVVRSLRSLVNSLAVLEKEQLFEIRLAVLDDHSAEPLLQKVREILGACSFPAKLVQLSVSGNGKSLRACYDYARENTEDLIYFVEDDYLHKAEALTEMVKSHALFSKSLVNRHVGLFPVDYIHIYEGDRMEPAYVVPGATQHWRTVRESTCTFLIPKKLLLEQWNLFVELTENGVDERNTINAIWRNHAVLFSPVPTLAVHLHGPELLPPFSDWKKLWDDTGKMLTSEKNNISIQKEFSRPAISILLPVFGAKGLFNAVFMKSYLAHARGSGAVELVVYDNGENGNDLEVWKDANASDITILGEGKNIGLNAALNACARVAKGDYFYLPHSDMYLMPGWAAALLEVAETLEPATFLLCSRSIEPAKGHTDFHIIQDYGKTWEQFDELKLLRDFTGFSDGTVMTGYRMPFFMHRKLWEKMRGVDPIYFSYATDDDLVQTAYDSGVRNFWMIGASLVYHLQGVSNAKQSVDRESDAPYDYFLKKWKKKYPDAEYPDTWHPRLIPPYRRVPLVRTRTDVINAIVREKHYSSYLEVGVGEGKNFREIQIERKVGIDPGTGYPEIIQNLSSDEFFARNTEQFDLIFIDGHHEEEQLIRDVENALRFLKPGGTIVCHDVNPPTESNQENPWVGNGTCWRGWVRLRSQRADLEMSVVDVDHGCGIITRGKQERIRLPQAYGWNELVREREGWLNLISVDEFLRRYA